MGHKNQWEYHNCPGFPGACHWCLLTFSLSCLFLLYRPFSGSLRFVQLSGDDDPRWPKNQSESLESAQWEIQLTPPTCIGVQEFWRNVSCGLFFMLQDDVNRLNTSPMWNLTSVAPGIKAQISVESCAPSRSHDNHCNRCSVQHASVEREAMFPPWALEILPSPWSPWCPPRESRRAFCHAGHRLRAVSEWWRWSDSPLLFWKWKWWPPSSYPLLVEEP